MEIKHDNRRPNNNTFNKKPNQTPNNPNKPKEQKHIFAELKAKYGPDFLNYGDLYAEFSKGPSKFTQLIRTIIKGNFDFNAYGYCLLNRYVIDRLIELAQLNYSESYIHYLGSQSLLSNTMVLEQTGIPFGDVERMLNLDCDKMTAWYYILMAFSEARGNNSLEPIKHLENIFKTAGVRTNTIRNLVFVI